MRTTPESKDMLDAMTIAATKTADGVMVNGPEDEILDWDAIDWRAVGDDVRRLRTCLESLN